MNNPKYIAEAKPQVSVNTSKRYSIVIPSAGIGYRCKTIGPKSLLKLGTKPNSETIIDRQIRLIRDRFKDCEIILIVGFNANRVMANTPRIIKVENENYHTTGISRSLGMGLRCASNDDVIVIYGDVVFSKEMLDVDFDKSTMLLSHNMNSEGIGVIDHNNKVECLSYQAKNKWAQISYITGKELKLLKKITWHPSTKSWLGYEALNKVLISGGKFQTQSPDGYAADVDSLKDLKKVQQDLKLH